MKIMAEKPRINDNFRWRTLTFFLFIVVFVAFLTFMQWIYLTYDKENEFLAYIHHHAEVLIPSWEPNKNFRYLSPFIQPEKNTSIIVGTNVCPLSSIPQVLVIVCSPIENLNYRVAIRKTWATQSLDKHNISVAFLIGLSDNADLNARIENENHLYEDLIVENFIENPYNNTLKSIFMLKWIIRSCSAVPFIMKTVDNTFLNLDNLAHFVNDPTRVKPQLLVGKLMPEETVNRDSVKDRYVPSYLYPYETFPDYLFGAGYLMTMATASLLYEKALATSYVHLEDVFITGLCAEAADITRYYDFRFYFIEHGSKRMDCNIVYQKKLIVHSHAIDVATIYQDYIELNKCWAEKTDP